MNANQNEAGKPPADLTTLLTTRLYTHISASLVELFRGRKRELERPVERQTRSVRGKRQAETLSTRAHLFRARAGQLVATFHSE